MASMKYWVWLATRKGLRVKEARQALEWFGTPEAIFFADPLEYSRVPGLGDRAKKALEQKELARVDMVLGSCERLGIRIMTCQDAAYPERLRNIYEPPLVLYVKGKEISFDEKVVVGMVGTRKCTPYGEKIGGEIALELALSGAVLASGIAEGIDTACIRGALKGGGSVVSVLGGGIDVIYPHCNRILYEDVASVGALISEYPPGTEHRGEHFPFRNRIISGLSVGVVVVESDLTGGSMRTVQHVEEQNRDLFAVPGPVDVITSAGTNQLISEGAAKLVRNALDVLEEYVDRFPGALRLRAPLPPEVSHSRVSRPKPDMERSGRSVGKKESTGSDVVCLSWSELRDKLTDDQRDILLALEDKPRIADDLIELTQIPARRILSALSILELQGYVSQEPGRRFQSQVKLKME